MKTAIANLPNYYSANNMQGRATKIEAYTMQADVFMTLHDFNSAKNSLENILVYSNQNKEKL
ncbi:RagB/SusD family nutrient uptake outer membrane protein, partial [Phocaeicola vulgatus]|nr:RagB/SusD family nutrient uptake outer membrane protein [Phocaeicola vulgatus]